MNLPRILRPACTACLTLALAFSLITAFVAPNPVDTAKAVAVAKGLREEDLSVIEVRSEYGVLGANAHVRFSAKTSNDSKAISVDLKRPGYSSKWRVSSYTGP